LNESPLLTYFSALHFRLFDIISQHPSVGISKHILVQPFFIYRRTASSLIWPLGRYDLIQDLEAVFIVVLFLFGSQVVILFFWPLACWSGF